MLKEYTDKNSGDGPWSGKTKFNGVTLTCHSKVRPQNSVQNDTNVRASYCWISSIVLTMLCVMGCHSIFLNLNNATIEIGT